MRRTNVYARIGDPPETIAANCDHCGGRNRSRPTTDGAPDGRVSMLWECADCGRFWPRRPELVVIAS